MSFLQKIKTDAGSDTGAPFLQRMRATAEKVQRAPSKTDLWERKLKSLKGVVGHDGVERVSFQDVCDHLEIPVKMRHNVKIRLSRMMRRLGWANIRAYGLNPQGYLGRVRGFAKPPPDNLQKWCTVTRTTAQPDGTGH